MEVVNISDKRKPSRKVKEFFSKNPHEFNAKEVLIMTALTVFVSGVITVSINTGVNGIQAIYDSRRNYV